MGSLVEGPSVEVTQSWTTRLGDLTVAVSHTMPGQHACKTVAIF